MFDVLNFLDSAIKLYDLFKSPDPVCCGKIGNAELMCVYNYQLALHHKQTPIQWSPVVEKEIYVNAGVFPQTEYARVSFCQELEKAVANSDLLAAWNGGLSDFERRFIKSRSPDCILADLGSLEPYYSGIPWTKFLKNKRVLVISPFVESIKAQYARRNLVWENNLLPEFELLTLYHPTSKAISTNNNNYGSWNDMINDLKSKMEKIDFDAALIGTGASSLPLASHAKNLGKKAIHLGGPLQILFGIKGGRWDGNKIIGSFFNDYWIRPSEAEIPSGYRQIEGGCYW